MDNKKELRKVHTKQGSSSMIVNIPIRMAKELGIRVGDYILFETDCEYIKFKKVEVV